MQEVQTECLQAVESLIHNLNTMSSRAGGQIPFKFVQLRCTIQSTMLRSSRF
uniref:anaerobic ribonucleoside-triphosphate reductase n=1 Tax=Paenibacillus sp. IHBB 10380 TaxID=1566358 RepID=UPI002D21C7E3|nr:anaerobic ribonucleoside-triphosphate reductase [Paenibacillus sp. IHBB 10380]